MKFSSVLLVSILGTSAAFLAPATTTVSRRSATRLRAATLEAPPAEEEQTDSTASATNEVPASTAEKDWPVNPTSNFVKDSDRILP